MTKYSELHICIMVVVGTFSVKLKLNEHEEELTIGQNSIISYTDKKVDCQAWETDMNKAAPGSTKVS